MINTKLSRKYIPQDEITRLYLMVELIAQEKTNQDGHLPLNLGYVIDRSGSMSGDKLAYTKQAIQYSVNHLLPSDYASLTVFDDDVDVLVAAQPIVYKDQFNSVVKQIFCGGCTNLSGGLSKGYREVMKHYQIGQLNRVLLLTDGLANRGITDKTKLCRKVKEMKNSGVSVTTLGVGDDFDEDLLTVMAEASGGNYFFI
jgi:Ca-activated chloride channel family protein